MNAQIKPAPAIKSLTDVLVINDSEVPEDFFTSDYYDQQIDAAIAATTGLVYALDDEGEKQARADATLINKYVKKFDSFIGNVFKSKTSKITIWRDEKKAKTKKLLENRQVSLNQFAEKRTEKLTLIRGIVNSYLNDTRLAVKIKPEFVVNNPDLTPVLKLSGTLTPNNALTKKAKVFIDALVSAELSEQSRIESRHLLLENRCLKAGINPPLTKIHFGTDFYADDCVFNSKVEELIAAEIIRKTEMEALIIEQQSAKQAEIDSAITRLQDAEEKPVAQPEKSPRSQPEGKPIAMPETMPVNGKHAVEIKVKFRMQISDRVTDKAVQDYFLKQLPEKIKSSIEFLETKSC